MGGWLEVPVERTSAMRDTRGVMKKFALLFGMSGLALLAVDPPKYQVIEEIIAKVNGDIVTKTELERQLAKYAKQADKDGLKGDELKQVVELKSQSALRDRIDELLLVQRAKDLSLNVDADVNRYVAGVQKQVGIADPDKFADAVRKETGQTFEDWKNTLRNTYLTQRVVGQEIRSKMQPSRDEVRKFYDEHKSDFIRKDEIYLREIFVSTTRPDAEKRAKELVEKARRGEKFTELARDNSDSPETAQREGELPAYGKGDLDPALEALVWNQEKGYVTDPIKRPNGWLILRVDERLKAGQATFEEVESQIQDVITRPQMEAEVRKYLTHLREDAFIEIKEGYVDSGAAPGKSTKWSDPAELKPEVISKSDLSQYRHKKLLWVVPLPGTKTPIEGSSASAVRKKK